MGHRHSKPATSTPPAADDRVITTKELLERIPLDRSTIWRMSRSGRFPAPIQLTPAKLGWRWSAVAAWLEERQRNPIVPRRYFKRIVPVLDNDVQHIR
jgi:prophage regulatory protein